MSFKLLDTLMVDLKDQGYCFHTFEEQLLKTQSHYNHILHVEVIGRSHEQRPIYQIVLGRGRRRIHVNGSHHANEWITSTVLMKSLVIICEMYEKNMLFGGVTIRKLLDTLATYDFVPMVNPDGVEIVHLGLSNRTDSAFLIDANEGSLDFSRWKANVRGVDLNRNYDAGFETYQHTSEKKFPSYAYYCGPKPGSEPESQALIELTNQRLYDMVLAYHTQGQVIYWDYNHLDVKDSLYYAKRFSRVSDYALDLPEANALGCGYKDWFINTFHKPGYTIECGFGVNPIASTQLDAIIRATLPIILLAGFTKKKRG